MQALSRLTRSQRTRAIKALGAARARKLAPIEGPAAWQFWARGKQYWRPDKEHKISFYSAGRGWGKTLTGSCAINLVAQHFPNRYGGSALLIGRTAADVRDVMVQGRSGIMATCDPDFRPEYQPSNRLITWPNGFQAMLRSADKPESLRGPNVGITWCDEWAHWQHLEDAWSNAQLCCRVGDTPHHIITSTPLPLQIVKDCIAGDFGPTKVTFGHTMENISGLAPGVVADLMRMWDGTTLGLQELAGMVLDQNERALWRQTMFPAIREEEPANDYFEVALSIDPAGGGHRKTPAGKKRPSDETGMILSGADQDQNIHLLEDLSANCSTREWCQRAVRTCEERGVDVVFVEINYGGGMVRDALEQTEGWAELGVRLVEITAKRSKGDRAAIAKGHYEKGKVRHIGDEEKWRKVEGQMTGYDPSLPRTRQDSPDRMDAAVWAILGHIRDGEAMAGNDQMDAENERFWGAVASKTREMD